MAFHEKNIDKWGKKYMSYLFHATEYTWNDPNNPGFSKAIEISLLNSWNGTSCYLMSFLLDFPKGRREQTADPKETKQTQPEYLQTIQ